MKIKSVEAHWVHIPIPPERQHTSDFGKTLSFDGTIVRIETECGITGWGEAKAQVGGMAQNQALTTLINDEFNLKLAPHLWAGAPAFAAGLAVAAASPAGFIVEYSLGANPLLHDLVEESFPVSDGMIEVPERLGLGITVREDFLAKHAVKS